MTMPDNNFSIAYQNHLKTLAEDKNFNEVVRGVSYQSDNRYVRPPFDRGNYESYRPNDRIPEGKTQQEQHEIMKLCVSAYERIGVVRSVIDMMSEFAAEGVEIVHEDEAPRKFYNDWWKRINGPDRCERFAAWLLQAGNTVVRRKYGTLPSSKIRIPLEYLFYDPSTVEIIGDELSALSENKIYGLKIASGTLTSILSRKPRTTLEKEVYNSIPQEIKDALNGKIAKSGNYVVPLPSDKIYIAHYKKHDTQIWAKSFIYSILSDIQYNDKLKLAKINSLDGMINVTRLWKLGDHTKELLPTPDAGAKLANIISNNTGAGPIDIIWDSAINLEEFYPPIENLQNFAENIPTILLGLGIPEGLIGGNSDGAGKGGMTANAMNMKNLVKRLEAVRREIRKWLNTEIDIIQKEMNFRKRPKIRFANADLHDEQVYYKLILDLVDRNIISDQRVLEIINEFPDINEKFVQVQEEQRKNGTKPLKASPYHNPQLESQQKHEIEKQKLSNKARQSANPNNSNNLTTKKLQEPRDPGRPKNSKDTKQRQRRQAVSYILEGMRVYDAVDIFVNKTMLTYYNVNNARSFTSAQKDEIEKAKRILMSKIEPNSDLSDNSLIQYFNNDIQVDLSSEFSDLLHEAGLEKITADQRRILMSEAYANIWGINEYGN